ncbi:MAG: GntR family transcriptional regulator [Caulobacteraceae bacterium]|nr:GntR family transcriptional regulator [Caulobacteraceae bacterium]
MAFEDAIQHKGWPVGAVFGPEGALAESFGVSVRVARQAFRLLEARGACRLQRGRGGGLIIGQPDIGSTALTMANHLIWSGATMDEVWDARMILEPLAMAEAAQMAGRDDLRDHGDGDEGHRPSFTTRIANPCTALVFNCLERFPGAMGGEATSVRAELIAAIDTGDVDLVARLSATDVDLRRSRDGGFLGEPLGLAATTHAELQSRRNLASALALRIGADISYQGCCERRRLGSLAELGEQYNTGLPVLIEAIRILENIGVVECLQGRVGGIGLRLPRWNSILATVYSYLAAAHASQEDCKKIPISLNMIAAKRAVENYSTSISREMEQILFNISQFEGGEVVLNWYNLQRVLYKISGNVILHAFTKCISGYAVRAYSAELTILSSGGRQKVRQGTRIATRGLLAGDAGRTAQGQAVAHAIVHPALSSDPSRPLAR